MSLRRKIDEARAFLVDPDALRETVERLVADEEISRDQANGLLGHLPKQVDETAYVLRNLGAHLGIGVVFAFDLVPLPLGTISRVAWVAGSRVVESTRGNFSRARVHSLGVLLIAAIPWFGYAAYLLPLRRRSPELAFVLANHAWLNRTGSTYEQFLIEARSPLRRFGRYLVPRPLRLDAARQVASADRSSTRRNRLV